MAHRACAAADRTGHAMLHTLYQQSLMHNASSSSSNFALDLIMDDRRRLRGVMRGTSRMARSHRFRAHLV